MLNFIIIQNVRIHKSTIKKYRPEGENKIYLYYSPSRNKIDSEQFIFNDSEERNECLSMLDSIL